MTSAPRSLSNVSETRLSEQSMREDLFCKNDEAPLLMSITQSNSFGSGTYSPEGISQEISLTLSGSSDSMGFDLKGSFDNDFGSIDQKTSTSPGASIASTGTKGTTSSSLAVESSNQIQKSSYPPYSRPNYAPPPPSYGRPPYHPVPYQHPYYGGHYPGGPPPPPPYGGHSNYPHPYYRSYPPPHPGYHPPPPHYMHGQVNTIANSSSSSITTSATLQTGSSQATSSGVSVSSNKSRKRTIDDVMDDSHQDFALRRGNSNGSVCTAGTGGNNTTSEAVNQLICESPIKQDPNAHPVDSIERINSMESTESALTFGGLSMTSSHDNDHKSRLPRINASPQTNENLTIIGASLSPSPMAGKGPNDGVTPISKNTKHFPFDSSAKHPVDDLFSSKAIFTTSTPLPHIDVVKGDSSQKSDSSSPALSLDIKEQLSWNIDGDISRDSLGETPVSFGSEISPTFWSGSNSPADQIFDGMDSPASLNADVMGGSPIPVFFNQHNPNLGGQKNDKNMIPVESKSNSINPTPGTPNMPLPSPYYHRTTTPHSSSIRPTSGHHPPNYQSPRPFYHHPNERVVNLRGRGPAPNTHQAPPMHLPPHLPSHHHFLTSPIGAPPPRNMMNMGSPHPNMPPSPFTMSSPHMSMSKRRCISLKQPIPSKFQGDMDKYKNAPIPEFTNLVNFPAHMSQKQAVNLPDGMRCCVMCGAACRCSSTKSKKGPKKDDMGRKGGNMSGNYAIIPTQNKGLCTQCDVNVWIVAQTQLEIKWCKGCKNFRPWAAFGEKGLATKCVRCRDRQREKYAAQKEEKDKKKAVRNRAK
uniref:Uncharacterized protein n=1 Tax=Chaetoceros debilis TaxID=122233 RepID=A0A7S3PWY9_9STRA